MSVDLSQTIAAKSDQLNGDDLIGGPRTITITQVSKGSAEQPVNIFFEGCANKPFRPCKTMRRALVSLWGKDGATYIGKSMTIFRDPNVTFGGMNVGGIRISHVSHIDTPMRMSLTATKGKKAQLTIQPLKIPVQTISEIEEERQETAPPVKPRMTPSQWADARVAAINSCQTVEELQSLTGSPQHVNAMGRLKETAPDQHAKVADAASAKAEMLMNSEPDFDTEAGELTGEPA